MEQNADRLSIPKPPKALFVEPHEINFELPNPSVLMPHGLRQVAGLSHRAGHLSLPVPEFFPHGLVLGLGRALRRLVILASAEPSDGL